MDFLFRPRGLHWVWDCVTERQEVLLHSPDTLSPSVVDRDMGALEGQKFRAIIDHLPGRALGSLPGCSSMILITKSWKEVAANTF